MTRRRLVTIATGGIVTVAIAVVITSVLHRNGASTPSSPPGISNDALADFLGQCRSYSSIQGTTDPEWARAERACNKALDIEPINAEAHELMRKIRFEKEMSKTYEEGKKALERSGEEEALDHFGQVKRDSYYYARSKALAGTAVEKAKRKAANDCLRYASAKQWSEARLRCERYMVLTCQNMSEEELHPPRSLSRDLRRKAHKGIWQPKDETYRRFLLVRERTEPNAAPWKCPRLETLADTMDSGAKVRSEVKGILDKKYADQEIAVALELYWANRIPDARFELQRLLSQTSRADVHELASDTLKKMDRAAALKIDGETALQRDDFNGADRRFTEALQYDAALTYALPPSYPSEIRKSIQRSFASKAFELGKRWVNQGDFKKACSYWRRGYAYYQGNLDLPRARRTCSEIANENVDKAVNCDGLAKVLDFAMDGDGIKERVNAKRVEMKCQ